MAKTTYTNIKPLASTPLGLTPVDSNELARRLYGGGQSEGEASRGSLDNSDNAFTSFLRTLPQDAELCEGVIHFAIPGTYTYKVYIASFKGFITCTDASTALLPHSPKTAYMYPNETQVLVWVHGDRSKGTIISASTPPTINPQFNFPSSISNIGTPHIRNREHVKLFLTNTDLNVDLMNFASSRAVDYCEGDYTVYNASEGGFHTGIFETSMRQAPDCGIWMFSMDRLIRSVGRSVQEFSFAHERYAGLDEHETYHFEGMSLYPWEALGYTGEASGANGKTFWKEQGNIANDNGVGFVEQEKLEATPFYRAQTYGGWIAQGVSREMRIPKEGGDGMDSTGITVAREHVNKDGTILYESARAIHFVKHVNIDTFNRVNEIYDPSGDDMENNNSQHKFSDVTSKPCDLTQSCITDKMLTPVRVYSGFGFRSHADESGGDFKDGREDLHYKVDLDPGIVTDLQDKPEVIMDEVVERRVDDQLGKVKYKPGRASISMLDDGAIVLRGACGEEIRLSGGNITLSCPGDVRINVGRSSITMAGDDIINRAHNSVDITASKKDVHIKAEKNMEIIGGVSGEGRTHIENCANGFPSPSDTAGKEGENVSGKGITLHAHTSMIQAFANKMYFRGVSGNGPPELLVDFSEGGGSQKFVAKTSFTKMSEKIQLSIAPTGEPGSPAIGGGRPTSILMRSGSVSISSKVDVFESLVARHLGSSDVPCLLCGAIMQRAGGVGYFSSGLESSLDSGTQEGFGGGGRVASRQSVDAYVFSYRTSGQCGASRFTFEEPYWMELYGENVWSGLSTWDERDYMYQGSINQSPWPGYEAWSSYTVRRVIPQLFDAAEKKDDYGGKGGAKPEGSAPVLKDFYRVMITHQ
jgi:hypothetical protein